MASESTGQGRLKPVDKFCRLCHGSITTENYRLFSGWRYPMTLTKAELSKNLMEKVRQRKRTRKGQQYLFPEFNYDYMSRRQAADILDTLFDIIKGTLEKGENVLISRFGKFQVRFKWARKGRNPQTGEQIILKSRRVVTFQCSPRLRKALNEDRRR
jgi:integration host factor subunit alpha